MFKSNSKVGSNGQINFDQESYKGQRVTGEKAEIKTLQYMRAFKKEIEENPRSNVKEFSFSWRINSSLVGVMERAGIIINKGTMFHPFRVWDSMEPNIHMAKEILNTSRKKSRESALRSKKIKAELLKVEKMQEEESNQIENIEPDQIEFKTPETSKKTILKRSILWGAYYWEKLA